MMTPTSLARFNDEQREAILHDGSTVVLAGPGSGKTDTIVAKVTRLLQDDVPAPRGVACLTYGNDAVREFTDRLRANDVNSGHRLFLGTVHRFCMQRVLRPFADLCGRPELVNPRVLTAREQLAVRGESLDRVGAVGEDPTWLEPVFTTIRRAIACDEDLSGFEDQRVAAAIAYDELLVEAGAVDFEAMTLSALRLLETEVDLRPLVVARYPWIAIDEYQDLGGPLHRIVTVLHDAGMNIFAVGDPDQCIFGFTGADPAYLNELAGHPDFHKVELKFNYRAGARLIAAAHASLGETRPHVADPSRSDPGAIEITEVPGGLLGQASYVVHDLVPDLLANGVPAEQIAILYKNKGDLLDALASEFNDSTVDFFVERDARFPSGPIVRWLQLCATRTLDPDGNQPLSELVALHPLRLDRPSDGSDELALRRALIDATAPADPDTPLDLWVDTLDSRLELTSRLAVSAQNRDDVDALTALRGADYTAIRLADFARGVHVAGRVVVTTLHSAKGRQFDVVIMPGLQRTLFPQTRWHAATRTDRPTDLAGDRRLLYVGITRARDQVHLVHSQRFTNRYGYDVSGRSPFIDEIQQRLKA